MSEAKPCRHSRRLVGLDSQPRLVSIGCKERGDLSGVREHRVGRGFQKSDLNFALRSDTISIGRPWSRKMFFVNRRAISSALSVVWQ